MEIKSKFSFKDMVLLGQNFVEIVAKRYDSNLKRWMYEVENRQSKFKAWVKENELKKQ